MPHGSSYLMKPKKAVYPTKQDDVDSLDNDTTIFLKS